MLRVDKRKLISRFHHRGLWFELAYDLGADGDASYVIMLADSKVKSIGWGTAFSPRVNLIRQARKLHNKPASIGLIPGTTLIEQYYQDQDEYEFRLLDDLIRFGQSDPEAQINENYELTPLLYTVYQLLTENVQPEDKHEAQ